ncbi:hypothetical protein V2A60_009086 [Cordyceps javanica]
MMTDAPTAKSTPASSGRATRVVVTAGLALYTVSNFVLFILSTLAHRQGGSSTDFHFFVIMATIASIVTTGLMTARSLCHRGPFIADYNWVFRGILLTLLLLVAQNLVIVASASFNSPRRLYALHDLLGLQHASNGSRADSTLLDVQAGPQKSGAIAAAFFVAEDYLRLEAIEALMIQINVYV